MHSINDIKIGQIVYHSDIYNGNELMTVKGMKEENNQYYVLLEGDYSGGTHNVTQRDWDSLEGVILLNTSHIELTKQMVLHWAKLQPFGTNKVIIKGNPNVHEAITPTYNRPLDDYWLADGTPLKNVILEYYVTREAWLDYKERFGYSPEGILRCGL